MYISAFKTVAEALGQQRVTLARAVVGNSCVERSFGAEQDDLALGARHGRVEQVALHHDRVRAHERQDDDGVLAALALVDGQCVGEREFTELAALVVDLELIAEVDRHAARLDGHDEADVAVEDLLRVVVLRLDDLVAEAEGLRGVREFRPLRRLRV